MEQLVSWIAVIWSAVALLAGVLVGLFWTELRRTQRSTELARREARIRSLDSKCDHFGFGIADLDVRLKEAHNDIAMLQADLKVRRQRYEELNSELREHWDTALSVKRSLAEQEQDEALLRSEIERWKDKLTQLEERLEQGQIKERTMRRELAGGLAAIFEQAGDALPPVVRLLLGHSINAGQEVASPREAMDQVYTLLNARNQLLETQLRYWQDRATGRLGPDDPEPVNELEPAALSLDDLIIALEPYTQAAEAHRRRSDRAASERKPQPKRSAPVHPLRPDDQAESQR